MRHYSNLRLCYTYLRFLNKHIHEAEQKIYLRLLLRFFLLGHPKLSSGFEYRLLPFKL